MAYANLNFVEVPSSQNATIRVRFDNSGQSYSYLGTDAKSITNQNKETTNFGWFNNMQNDSYDSEYARTMLHELGHVLGLVHEHQSPASPVVWNETAVYNWAASTQEWDQETAYRNIIKKYTTNESNYTAFDGSSIMIYGLPKSLISNGYTLTENRKLSQTDKNFISTVYPFNGTKRFYRCYLSNINAHFYTPNFDELKNQNYTKYIECAMGKVYNSQVSGSTKLYRYFNGKDHFYTTNYNELGAGKNGYKLETDAVYVYKSANNGHIPVYRYWNSSNGTHFYTTNFNELGNGKSGWKYEGIGFYILPN